MRRHLGVEHSGASVLAVSTASGSEMTRDVRHLYAGH